jgi:hypothetical protein
LTNYAESKNRRREVGEIHEIRRREKSSQRSRVNPQNTQKRKIVAEK